MSEWQMKTTCAQCRFWQSPYAGDPSPNPRPFGELGECRRHSPQPRLMIGMFAAYQLARIAHVLMQKHGFPDDQRDVFDPVWDQSGSDDLVSWPQTEAVEWCGEWEARAKADTDIDADVAAVMPLKSD